METSRDASLEMPQRLEHAAGLGMSFAKDKGGTSLAEGFQLSKSPLLRAILMAQVLSLLLCVMGTTSGLLVSRGVNMPTSQAVLNYLLLAFTCGAYHLHKRGFHLSNPWYIYFFLACLDVEANFLVTKAYQYTSVTSVTLLDCFTIPAVMVLSALVLRARYLPGHFLGALLCIGGLAVLVVTDGSSSTGGPDPLLGDALVLMGAILYACSNVAQERLLLRATPVSELLAVMGSFAVLIGGLQAVVLESGAWLTADWSDPWAVAAPLAGFALALYTFALLMPLVLMWSGATVLNLSLLTSDIWAAGTRVAFFGGFGGTAGWFALSLFCEALGLVLYTRTGQTHPHPDSPWIGGGIGVSDPVATGGARGISDSRTMPYQRISSVDIYGDKADPEASRESECKPSLQNGLDSTSDAAALAIAGLAHGLYGSPAERRWLFCLRADGYGLEDGECEAMATRPQREDLRPLAQPPVCPGMHVAPDPVGC
ncbi:hypothetical protein Vafri_11618 [Volvox africanus]|uniref:EamA domain-containing protein n=1 Tax=Volvox africanus TaxID=51714 RepID=A0A8J4BD59_9CHLO|nr:hypothetical protein Vafri_11618 [Volvox africanus]